MTAPLAEQVAAALNDLIVDDPMWIGDDGQPLDYLPERESRIGDFIDAGADAVLRVVAEWLGSEAAVETTARVMASMEPGEDWPSNLALGGNLTGTRDDEYRDGMREEAAGVLKALRDATRPPDAPNAPAPVSGATADTRGAEDGAEGRGEGDALSTITGPPGPPGPPTHEHDDGSQCMWVTRGGIDRWRQVDPTGWDLGSCPGGEGGAL